MPVPVDQLNSAESAVWEAFPAGTLVDLASAGERLVRAEVVAALLRGIRPAEPGQSAGIHLSGAIIAGVLDLTYATITVPLSLHECDFDSVPNLTGAILRGVDIMSCRLPGLRGRLMRVEGTLDLRQSVIRGRLSLVRATITGELRLNGAHLINPGDWAFFGGGMVVESALFGRFNQAGHPGDHPLVVEGGFRMVGARVLGGVFLNGVTLSNPGGAALRAENMTVFGRMMCGDGFQAQGRVQLSHAHVQGELSFAGASLLDPAAALALHNAAVTDLNLRTAQPVAGVIDLRHAHCDVLRDEFASWPAHVALDGFVYEAIDTDAQGLRVVNRLDWLSRDQDGYRAQPYEQLAALYRRQGADGDARRVLLEKQCRRRRELRLPARALGHLLEWTVGYGYRPWRASLWLSLLLAAGTAVFTQWPPSPSAEQANPHFDAVMYSLDLLVPFSAFGLRDAFVPTDGTRWVAYGLIAAGWVLATALLAGITRALRRD
jgi:hypothetical protein